MAMADLEADRALARRMLAGDDEAFDVFFARSFPSLFRFALSRLGQDPDLAEDVVQATLVKAIAKLATYRGEAALFTWMCTFCRHEISAVYRQQGRRRESELVEERLEVRAALDSLLVAGDDHPADRYQRREVKRLVQVALDHLPQHYGQALEWKYIQGLPVKEIARRLELGPKAAESLLTRARQAFRDAFTALLEGSPSWAFGSG